MAIFKRRHIDKVLAGEKTQTRMTHKHELCQHNSTVELSARMFKHPRLSINLRCGILSTSDKIIYGEFHKLRVWGNTHQKRR
jgi:hypothetical protein